ncbi:hypothetical protein Fmac_030125 [Flemingia macrophylla]|uniref:PB1 domain-containing protein n=1 Tax=Flemingia macrophylla TaxID=520843 RepID=A0ABD1LCG7_9FABA
MDPPPLSAIATTQKNYSDLVDASSPRSRNVETWSDETLPVIPGSKLRLMCSYGGHIIPRPHDKSLCYIGGDTRIVVVDRHSSLKDLCARLSRTILNGRPFTLKYQLPNEDLDSLITVTTDEDLDNMVEEYDRIAAKGSASSRLRVFLFFTKPEATVSMGSLLDDVKSETWFVDALNNSGMLNRVVSDSAAGDSFVNLDGDGVGVGGVSASGSSNNLEALPDANNKGKNLPDVVQVNSTPGSPMMENSSSSPSFSPSMANLPPIRVRVDDNGSRLQQENKVGVMVEDQFAQMTIASGVKPDEGLVNVVSSAVAVPAIPAAVTMTSVGLVTSSDHVTNRVVSDDERSDHGFRKPPLPLQLVQPKISGGLSLPSPDSVTSDSSIASANSFSKIVYYQDQVQAALLDNKPVFLPNAKSEISDQVIQVSGQVQDSGYTLPAQLDQTKQIHQQKPLIHASPHYIHHPAATGTVPGSSYYPVYAPPPPQQLHHPIGQQQYPVYVMPIGPTQPYNMALQPNIGDPNAVRPLMPQSAVSVTSAAYKDGTPPIYPTKSVTVAPTIPEVTPSVYKAPPVASNPAYAPIPPNQFQPQYVGLPQFHHPPQSIAVAPSGTTNYGYEYGGHVQDQVYYTQQHTTTAPLLPQYQSMTPAAAAAALSDASNQYPVDNIQQPNRASQPV